jgi:hypothetical protein
MEWKWHILLLTAVLIFPGCALAADRSGHGENPRVDADHPLIPMPSSPYVVSTTPTDGSVGVDIGTKISITFDVSMNAASTAAATTSYPKIDWYYPLPGYSKKVTFTPTSLNSNTQYTIDVGTDAESQSGSKMQSPYSFSFKTAVSTKSPTVKGTYPPDEGYSIGRLPRLKIFFSDGMGPDVTSSVSITHGTLSSSTFYPDNRTLVFDASALPSNMYYSVTVNASLARDTSGNPLDGNGDGRPWGDYTFGFLISDIKPAHLTATAFDTADNISMTSLEFELIHEGITLFVKNTYAHESVSFGYIIPGNYTLVAKREGYAEGRANFELTPGEELTAKVPISRIVPPDYTSIIQNAAIAMAIVIPAIVIIIFKKKTWRCPSCKKWYWQRYSLCSKCGYDIHTKSNVVITFKKR